TTGQGTQVERDVDKRNHQRHRIAGGYQVATLATAGGGERDGKNRRAEAGARRISGVSGSGGRISAGGGIDAGAARRVGYRKIERVLQPEGVAEFGDPEQEHEQR